MTHNTLEIIRRDSTGWNPGSDDAIWHDVPSLNEFRFWWNQDEPSVLTSVQFFHDGKRLCFRFIAQEDETVLLPEPLQSKMDVIREGRVEIFLEAEPDMTRYYGLEMDPLGRVLDYQATFYRTFQRDWTFPELTLNGRITSCGYEVEGTMNLAVLRALDILKADDTIRAGLYRAAFRYDTDKSVIERWASWVDPQTDQPDFHVPSSLGTLILIDV